MGRNITALIVLAAAPTERDDSTTVTVVRLSHWAGASMDSEIASEQPVVLVIAPTPRSDPHDHSNTLTQAGFRVVTFTHDQASVPGVLRLGPRIIVAELADGESRAMFDLLRLFKTHQSVRHIPVIVYGIALTAGEIETIARVGAMWLQLEPTDGFKLVGAVRGVLRAA
jgi:hypothetical protein